MGGWSGEEAWKGIYGTFYTKMGLVDFILKHKS